MVADGWLADGAAIGEVAGADRSRGGGEHPYDLEPNGIGDRLEELDVRICSLHTLSISTIVNIWAREEVTAEQSLGRRLRRLGGRHLLEGDGAVALVDAHRVACRELPGEEPPGQRVLH